MDKQDAEAMNAIIEALAHFNDPRAFTYLSETLKLPNIDHYEVLRVLGNSRDPQFLEALLALPIDKQDTESVTAIIRALA